MADEKNSLFWRVGRAGGTADIIFGYARVGAAVAPDIVTDGDRLVDSTQSVVMDMSPNIKFPPTSIDRKSMKPIMQVLSPDVANQLRAALSASPAKAELDSISGFEATIFFMAEGQHRPEPSVGGTIFEYARGLGRTSSQLLSDNDMAGLYTPPNLPAINAGITEPQITYLLQLRQQVGPIGAYLEKLYCTRHADELAQITSDIDKHGVPSVSKLFLSDKVEQLLQDRAIQAVTGTGLNSKFLLLPVGILTGESGLLRKLSAQGLTVTPVA